ncbi:hypothetical protein SAY87_026899 [Trapa incisa]|uniref:Myb-like domain-containing protein n=1 Tax=Trapa incisa TaxID=236973 RepID=A0AAN7GMI8_9MYRT|nr:hypothetical protein SAY87_026899 [Trapa incisa]
MGRAPCCDKANVNKGPWSPEEDATLKSYIEQNGPVGNWIALPQKIVIADPRGVGVGVVNDLPLMANLSQISPNQITGGQASLMGFPLQYPNDIIPAFAHYPFERSTFLASLQPSHHSTVDSLTTQAALLNNEVADFSLSDMECCGLLDLLGVPDTGNAYGSHEMVNGSVCSSAPASSGAGSYGIWGEISSLLLAENRAAACPPLLCDYEAHSQSQTVAGGRGLPEESSLEGSMLYVGQC